MKKGISILYIALFLAASTAYAKDDIIGIDGSFQLGIFDLNNSVSEKPIGLGGRVGYYLSSIFFLDAEMMHFPQNPSGNFGETLVLGGLRVGTIFDRIGVYAKARSGMIRFGGSHFDLRFEDKTANGWSSAPASHIDELMVTSWAGCSGNCSLLAWD
jgi:hypothetical protein